LGFDFDSESLKFHCLLSQQLAVNQESPGRCPLTRQYVGG